MALPAEDWSDWPEEDPDDINPLFARKDEQFDLSGEVPDIIEFVVSDKFLNRPLLYPRQATLLKLIFLQTELLTDYDYDVIEEWTNNFSLPSPDRIAALGPDDSLHYEGYDGIVPDVLDRIDLLRERGHRWFREVIGVAGRRGSKGYIGGIAGAYVLWHYIRKGNPQGHYGIAQDKTLAALVFAAKKQQATDNQWKDLADVITGAPCFARRIPKGQPQTEMLRLTAPNDKKRERDLKSRGIIQPPQPSFQIEPKEATKVSARGPASCILFFDEMAWVVKEVARASAAEVYGQAKPSLDQFGKDAFVYAASSPWQMTGQFYTNYLNALEVDRETFEPVYPEYLTFQLASWMPYQDYERAHEIERVPITYASPKTSFHFMGDTEEWKEGEYAPRKFKQLKNSIQEYDDAMRREERANPETFKVERRARWATIQDAYLRPEKVEAMFGRSWTGETLTMQNVGILSTTYVAHGDPSKSGANFGWAIGHIEGPDERGLMHVVFDVVKAWRPQDYDNNEIDYIEIESEIKGYISAFNLEEITFDQFNSVRTIQELQRYARETPLPKRATIEERTATKPQNWIEAETFKGALNLGLVHAPEHELAQQELKFLQESNGRVDHPTSGPVQTKDVADCLMAVTYKLIGGQMDLYIKDALKGTHTGGALQGGTTETTRRQSDSSVHDALSGFGRGRNTGSSNPARSKGGVASAPRRPSRVSRYGGGIPRNPRRRR